MMTILGNIKLFEITTKKLMFSQKKDSNLCFHWGPKITFVCLDQQFWMHFYGPLVVVIMTNDSKNHNRKGFEVQSSQVFQRVTKCRDAEDQLTSTLLFIMNKFFAAQLLWLSQLPFQMKKIKNFLYSKI